eukprot:scaffold1690_cov177-Ochromonas_danica.AAC.18
MGASQSSGSDRDPEKIFDITDKLSVKGKVINSPSDPTVVVSRQVGQNSEVFAGVGVRGNHVAVGFTHKFP